MCFILDHLRSMRPFACDLSSLFLMACVFLSAKSVFYTFLTLIPIYFAVLLRASFDSLPLSHISSPTAVRQ